MLKEVKYENIYKGCLKTFRPQYEDSIIRQQTLGNDFVHALKGTYHSFSHFGQ